MSDISYGYTESANSEPVGPKFLRITDIQDGAVDWGAVPYCEIEPSDHAKHKLRDNDIVFARTGATTGKSYLISSPPDAVPASYLIRLRLADASLLPKFVSYFFQSAEYWEAVTKGLSGSAQGGFNASKLAALLIPVPSIPEQRCIVAILDEAFEAIATATANAEKNLANARDAFRSELRRVFSNDSTGHRSMQPALSELKTAKVSALTSIGRSDGETKTGGRAATTRHIRGNYSLCVGMPELPTQNGWTWSPLEKLARMESGHTPSRRHPEYWGGEIPWLSIVDAKRAHGETIAETLEQVTELGIENSSARVLPAKTVCLSRTASIGYVTVLARPMATSQDFVDWVCSKELEPSFLKYLLLAQRDELFKFSSGAVHQTIYFPEAKAFCIRHPDVEVQKQIVKRFDFLKRETEKLAVLFQAKLSALGDLRQSILAKAFSGELRVGQSTESPSFSANILAFAYERHRNEKQENTFGRVKAQKLLHLVEASADVDLGRQPIKDAAGPNDFQHMLRAEEWAEKNDFFRFRRGDGRYHFERLSRYKEWLLAAQAELNLVKPALKKIVDLLLPMDSETAEVTATVYAGWNNLILDGREASDEAIVRSAREEWHRDKLNISRGKFFDAIRVLRRADLVPTGKAKRVGQKSLL